MDRRYMAMQYVAVVRGRFCRFMVFRTGDEQYYLFCPLDRDGCLSTWQFPVKISELRPDIRRALRHGWGNTGIGAE